MISSIFTYFADEFGSFNEYKFLQHTILAIRPIFAAPNLIFINFNTKVYMLYGFEKNIR